MLYLWNSHIAEIVGSGENDPLSNFLWFSKCLLNNIKKKTQEIIKIQNVTLITAEGKNEKKNKTEQLVTFIAVRFLSSFPNVDRIRFFLILYYILY